MNRKLVLGKVSVSSNQFPLLKSAYLPRPRNTTLSSILMTLSVISQKQIKLRINYYHMPQNLPKEIFLKELHKHASVTFTYLNLFLTKRTEWCIVVLIILITLSITKVCCCRKNKALFIPFSQLKKMKNSLAGSFHSLPLLIKAGNTPIGKYLAKQSAKCQVH